MSARSTLLKQWLDQQGYRDYHLRPASEDASFRSYLRLQTEQRSLIVMDAPPDKEPCDQFILVADKLRAAGLSAPEIIARNREQGFLILTDFGSSDYLSQLSPETEAELYRDALSALQSMQTRIEPDDLPPYDSALLQREMDLFHDWFLGKLMGILLGSEQQAVWQSIKRRLVENALAQPRVFVHRDYHSRNLMWLEQDNPGILDFQDAMNGPLTYDLVSLLRDCYIAWPPSRDVEAAEFMRWFDLMGVQRHLKAIGIFSRLKIRDGKTGYLKDIPRTLQYVRQVSAAQTSMAELLDLLETLDLKQRVAALAAG
jgi:aminoglycoside/choline kinase family phosphotransferase